MIGDINTEVDRTVRRHLEMAIVQMTFNGSFKGSIVDQVTMVPMDQAKDFIHLFRLKMTKALNDWAIANKKKIGFNSEVMRPDLLLHEICWYEVFDRERNS